MSAKTKNAGGSPKPLYRQLRARKNASPEHVNAHQRARLHGAMVEAVARHGYTAMTVEELTRLAGVTKKALYKHFDDKLDCFLATYDVVVRDAVRRISTAYRDGAPAADEQSCSMAAYERDWQAGLLRAFDAFTDEIVLRPKPAQLALVEVLAVGPAALGRVERGEAAFARMISQSLAQAGGDAALSPILLRGVEHGVWYVARSRLTEAEPAALAGCSQQLVDWLLSYRCAAAAELERAADLRPRCAERARRAQRSDGEPLRRMLRAAALIVAEGGYEALTSGQIVALADVEWETFSQHFASVEDCFLAALELLSAQVLGRALRDSEQAQTWPAAVCRAVERLLAEVANDPVFARVAFVEIFAAGPAGAQRRAALMRSFTEVLMRQAPASRRPSPLVAEAITGAVWGIVHHHVVHGRASTLRALAPHACYLTLAPIVGAEQAIETIVAARTATSSGVERSDPVAAAA